MVWCSGEKVTSPWGREESRDGVEAPFPELLMGVEARLRFGVMIDVRRIMGVKPVVSAVDGPGSENRTLFLAFRGVLAAGIDGAATSRGPSTPTLLRRVRRRAMGRLSSSMMAGRRGRERGNSLPKRG